MGVIRFKNYLYKKHIKTYEKIYYNRTAIRSYT